MSAYRDSTRPACESHTWAAYWRPLAPGGVEDLACSMCGARVRGWMYTAWLLGVWLPSVGIIGRPPEPPPW